MGSTSGMCKEEQWVIEAGSGLQSIKWSITAGYIALNPMENGLMDRLREARYFAILDAKFGYHHMPINEEEELSAIR